MTIKRNQTTNKKNTMNLLASFKLLLASYAFASGKAARIRRRAVTDGDSHKTVDRNLAEATSSMSFFSQVDSSFTYCVEKFGGNTNFPPGFNSNDPVVIGDDDLFGARLPSLQRGVSSTMETVPCLSRTQPIGTNTCEFVGKIIKAGSSTGAGYHYGIYDCRPATSSRAFYAVAGVYDFCVEKVGGNTNFPVNFNQNDPVYVGGDNLFVDKLPILYRGNDHSSVESFPCLSGSNDVGSGTCKVVGEAGENSSTGAGYRYRLYDCRRDPFIQVNYCPSQYSKFHPHDQNPVLDASAETVSECIQACDYATSGEDGRSCEFAYFSNGDCHLYGRNVINGELNPPGYASMPCYYGHTAPAGTFIVREYELFMYFSEKRLPVGDLPLKMVSAVEQMPGTEEHSYLSIDLLSSGETDTDHCESAVTPPEGHSDAAGTLYCYDKGTPCNNVALEYAKDSQCGSITRNAGYNWSTHLAGEGITDRAVFWDSQFKDIVVESLNGAMTLVSNAVEYLCDFRGECDLGDRYVRSSFLNKAYTMPEEGGVVLIRHLESVVVLGEPPVKDVAHFSYHFKYPESESWKTGAPPDGSFLCSAELGIAMGVAGFIPGLGAAVGVAGIGLSIGCATDTF